MGISTQMAKDLNSIDELSRKDEDMIRLLILDFFAAALAGYRVNREFNDAVETSILPAGGTEESCVIFQNKRYPSETAAFMNAVYGHGAELDDGNKRAAGHMGVHVIPAVFALADKCCSSNDDVLIAIATGYEAFVRISSAAQPGLVQRGFHSTGTVGALASAAACARLYHTGSDGMEDAIALATTMSSGLLSYGDSRPAVKPLNPGKAAANGVLAATLAAKGVKGPAEALEGPNGWFHAMTDTIEENCLKDSGRLLLHESYFKQYPSCRHTHCGIDAAVALHEKTNVNEIKEIKVHIYPAAIKLAGLSDPRNPDDTKFSISYTLACALVKGAYGIEDMDPDKAMPEIKELEKKIALIPDNDLEDRVKGIRGARVEVITTDGEIIEEKVMSPKGDPENPFTKADIIRKIKICAGACLGTTEIDRLIENVDAIKGSGTFVNPMMAMKV